MKRLILFSFLAVQLAGGGVLCRTLCVGKVFGQPKSPCHDHHHRTSQGENPAPHRGLPGDGQLPPETCCCPGILTNRSFVEKNALEGLGLLAPVALAPSQHPIVVPFHERELVHGTMTDEPGARVPLYLIDRHLII